MKRVGIIAGIIIILAGLVLVDRVKQDPGKVVVLPVPTDTAAEEFTPEKALASGRDFWCKYNVESKSGEGMLYVSGVRFRNDFVTGNNQDTHTAFDGDYYYIWGDKGLPMKLVVGLIIKDEATRSARQMVETEIKSGKKTGMKCLSWSVDEKLLALPTRVEFVDISQRIRNLKNNTEQ